MVSPHVPRLIRRVKVAGLSMAPALLPGDRVLVLRVRRPRVGEVVALPDPRLASRVLVKRVAAVDGSRLTLLGDNPGQSTDSRTFGPVDRADIHGRVVYRYWPPERRGRLT
jgi:nickel-type superoxide dismutase maturation protease